MPKQPNLRHPRGDDLYTPMNDQVLELFDRMLEEWGSWRRVAWKSNMRLKALRNLRQSQRTAVSMSLIDRMTTGCGVGGVHEFEWYTPDELIDLGIWKPVQHVVGRLRIRRSPVGMLTNDANFKNSDGKP